MGYTSHPKMPYCLEKWEDWTRNIILPEVADYIMKCKADAEVKGDAYPLHKYLHHGLSSQAMAFNLFGAMKTRNDYQPIHSLLKTKGITDAIVHDAQFELDDRKVFEETKGQPTSIDIALKDETDRPFVFIESKLVEREFGGCSVFSAGDCPGMNPVHELDECYLHFVGRKYWMLMEKHGILPMLDNDRICPFTSYYQFFREMIFSIEKGGYFVLLCDERSAVFQPSPNRGLVPFLKTYLPDNLKNTLSIITVQEVVGALKESGKHDDWIDVFCERYGCNPR